MIELINEAYANCNLNHCLEVENSQSFIVVDTTGGRSEIFRESELPPFPYLTIKNPNEKNINFLAIDECIYFSADGKKCDCAVFDENRFCFVEIKSGMGKSRRHKKQEAAEQLKNAIRLFKNNIDFSSYEIEAILCVGFKTSFPRIKASSIYLSKDFQDSLNAELFEGNEIEF